MTASEAAIAARREVDALAAKREDASLLPRLVVRWIDGGLSRDEPGYRMLMLSDAVYHGVTHMGSPWRSMIDATSGRLLRDVRR